MLPSRTLNYGATPKVPAESQYKWPWDEEVVWVLEEWGRMAEGKTAGEVTLMHKRGSRGGKKRDRGTGQAVTEEVGFLLLEVVPRWPVVLPSNKGCPGPENGGGSSVVRALPRVLLGRL